MHSSVLRYPWTGKSAHGLTCILSLMIMTTLWSYGSIFLSLYPDSSPDLILLGLGNWAS